MALCQECGKACFPFPWCPAHAPPPPDPAWVEGMTAGMEFARREKCYDNGHGHQWSVSGMGWPMYWTRHCSQCLRSEPCAEPPGLLDRRIG